MWLILRLVMAQKKNTLCVRPLFRVRAKIEKKRHLWFWPLVRVEAKIEKDTFLVYLWFGFNQEKKKKNLCGCLWLGLGQK